VAVVAVVAAAARVQRVQRVRRAQPSPNQAVGFVPGAAAGRRRQSRRRNVASPPESRRGMRPSTRDHLQHPRSERIGEGSKQATSWWQRTSVSDGIRTHRHSHRQQPRLPQNNFDPAPHHSVPIRGLESDHVAVGPLHGNESRSHVRQLPKLTRRFSLGPKTLLQLLGRRHRRC
jgi:hypothetical protein